MNILVTGCSGFVGFGLCLHLLDKNYYVHGISRSSESNNVKQLLKYKNFKLIEADLSIPKKTIQVFDIDVIIHAAGQSPYNAKASNDYVDNNIIATQNIINFALDNRVNKVVFTSSISIYGQIEDVYVNECTLINKPELYGVSKYLCESLFHEYDSSFNTIALRLPGVVGKNAHAPWLARVLKKVKRNENIEIYNPSALFNNIILVDTLIDFIEHLCQYDFKGFDILTVAALKEKTIVSLLNSIIDLTQSTSKLIVCEKNSPSFLISNQKAIDKYGYKPISVDKSIERFLKQEGMIKYG